LLTTLEAKKDADLDLNKTTNDKDSTKQQLAGAAEKQEEEMTPGHSK
jgi:hypothetical protein